MPLPEGITEENWREKLNVKGKSLDEVIDLLGDVKTQLKLFDKMEGFLREVLLSRMPDDVAEYDTNVYHVQRTQGARTVLDTKKVREEMGEEWYDAHCTTTSYTMVRVIPVKGDSAEGKG